MAPRPHSSQPLRPSQDDYSYDDNPRDRRESTASWQDQPPYRPTSSVAASSPFQDSPAGTSRYADQPSRHSKHESFESRRQSALAAAGVTGGGGRASGRARREESTREEEEEEDGYGQEEDEGRGDGWDVYADFNNTGPRYSTAPLTSGISSSSIAPPSRGGGGPNNDRSSKSYRPISTYGEGQPIVPSGPNYSSSAKSIQGGSVYGGKAMSAAQLETSELVTVPVLGADWKRSELHSLSKQGKKEAQQEKRDRMWKRFKRDEDRQCWGASLRQLLVWGTFGLCIAVGLTVYFVIPRIPSYEFDTTQPIQAIEGATNTSDTILFSRTPANFSFPALVSLAADSESTYIPVHLTSISAIVSDLGTGRQVANGTWSGTFKAKTITNFNIPVTFSYAAINSSDTTWNNYYTACAHIYTGTVRPTLNVKLTLTSKASGRIGATTVSQQISSIACPYELPSDSA
ncbi:hypothetical protein BDY24DRAFT_385184 [Mrakia frigida]|uniref:uncharacterized protein n=1 Tax=Mrakia frigida TaxID=29902 RepID=UPI003FCC0149